MTGRERLEAIFNGDPVDRLSWSTIIDKNTLSVLPEHLRHMDYFDFHRYVRSDSIQLGGWESGWELDGVRVKMPAVGEHSYINSQGDTVIETSCPRGVLTKRLSAHNHPVEFPVKSVDDLRVLLHRYENACCEAIDDIAAFGAIEGKVGESGIATLYMHPSAIPDLLENLIGIEGFYYLLQDHPDEMNALIHRMQELEISRFEIASQHPCKVLILTENTSTRYISPSIYAKYNLASQQAFVEAVHKVGKTAILHMCGHVNDLLSLIKETDADGIHVLTPPPLGDTPWERALDVIGEHLIIIGCLTPDIWLQCPVADMGTALDLLITPRIRESRFVLLAAADGIPVPIERFLAVRDWVESSS